MSVFLKAVGLVIILMDAIGMWSFYSSLTPHHLKLAPNAANLVDRMHQAFDAGVNTATGFDLIAGSLLALFAFAAGSFFIGAGLQMDSAERKRKAQDDELRAAIRAREESPDEDRNP